MYTMVTQTTRPHTERVSCTSRNSCDAVQANTILNQTYNLQLPKCFMLCTDEQNKIVSNTDTAEPNTLHSKARVQRHRLVPGNQTKSLSITIWYNRNTHAIPQYAGLV